MKKLVLVLAGLMMMLSLVACGEQAAGIKGATEPNTTVGAATEAPKTTAASSKADEGDEMEGSEDNAGGGPEDNGDTVEKE